ncbi:hypothetical protein AFIC_001027 [[Pseudomonas] carboxydohydrogena]|uniref:Uncharacterized protein n=1 Tax=Afipia carboxydohydrogena TaxID=290 RepID=A0ABY8BUA1_AFICR|nr:hypothetical protein [[Pseudomonas] carboxydohydrogena]WEF52536.1 hypothetical protein AFIC_001027 [[Pseudomonas] carboxydohydrogena]
MCNCHKRGIAIVTGTRALAAGDTETAKEQVKVFARTIADDVAAFRSKIASAKTRLARR